MLPPPNPIHWLLCCWCIHEPWQALHLLLLANFRWCFRDGGSIPAISCTLGLQIASNKLVFLTVNPHGLRPFLLCQHQRKLISTCVLQCAVSTIYIMYTCICTCTVLSYTLLGVLCPLHSLYHVYVYSHV